MKTENKKMNYLTYTYSITPLHTGASTQAGNLVGIAREVHTNLPYMPSSSLRGKIRAVLEDLHPEDTGTFFGERIKNGNQPTEGEVWFADATLLLFPIASYSHQFVWITCPLWLSRWNRWLKSQEITELIDLCNLHLRGDKRALTSVSGNSIYLQGALLKENQLILADSKAAYWSILDKIPDGNGLLDLRQKLVIISNDDCAGLVEVGLQREVRICLETDKKIVASGSFRSEEAIPSETVMFFPWGVKPSQPKDKTKSVLESLKTTLNSRLQFGGSEGLGKGWTENTTIEIASENRIDKKTVSSNIGSENK